MNDFKFELDGFCPICERETTFSANHPWFRGNLFCRSCDNGSIPRERALAFELQRLLPKWRDLNIHESSPSSRGISKKLGLQCRNYIATQYYPDQPPGSIIDGFRNENIESSSFDDETFDLVVTLDVAEHLFNPEKMFGDVYRTLKPGGYFLSTFPIRKYLVKAAAPLAKQNNDGTIIF